MHIFVQEMKLLCPNLWPGGASTDNDNDDTQRVIALTFMPNKPKILKYSNHKEITKNVMLHVTEINMHS